MKRTPQIESSDSPQIAEDDQTKSSGHSNIGQFAAGLGIAIAGFIGSILLMPLMYVLVALSSDPSQPSQSVIVGAPQAVFGVSAFISFTIIGIVNTVLVFRQKGGTVWTGPFLMGFATGLILEAGTLIRFFSCAFCKLQ